MKISRGIGLLASFCIIAGCGVGEQEAESQDGPALATSHSALTVCGFTCPADQHPTSYTCSSSCGYCSISNATTCEPNTGTSFGMCGTPPTSVCPGGYHPTQYYGKAGCQTTSTGVNATWCYINTASFTQCGFTCPSGYRLVRYVLVSGCGYGVTANGAVCSL